jgi:hypothetical protein
MIGLIIVLLLLLALALGVVAGLAILRLLLNARGRRS